MSQDMCIELYAGCLCLMFCEQSGMIFFQVASIFLDWNLNEKCLLTFWIQVLFYIILPDN